MCLCVSVRGFYARDCASVCASVYVCVGGLSVRVGVSVCECAVCACV
jgi:hypothetical protein